MAYPFLEIPIHYIGRVNVDGNVSGQFVPSYFSPISQLVPIWIFQQCGTIDRKSTCTIFGGVSCKILHCRRS